MSHSTFLASVLARLSAVRFPDLPRVAEGSGVPESTVRKLRYGEVKNPRVYTVQALHDYFEQQSGSAADEVRESAGAPNGSMGRDALKSRMGNGQVTEEARVTRQEAT